MIKFYRIPCKTEGFKHFLRMLTFNLCSSQITDYEGMPSVAALKILNNSESVPYIISFSDELQKSSPRMFCDIQ